MNDCIYLGFDIGGTKCAALVGREHGGDFEILGRRQIATAGEKSPEAALARLGDEAEALVKELGCPAPAAVGVSCGGPLDAASGRILSPPNLPGWDDVPVTDILGSRFGVPAYLQNDANACALAEWQFGAGKDCRNMVFLTFGTGMGAGLILNGALYDGTCGNAGEVGHMRLAASGPVGYGKAGSFEGFCSGGGIAQTAKTMVLEKLQRGEHPAICPTMEALCTLTAKSVGDAAEAGDAFAQAIYRACAEKLGMGLSILIDLLNPERIVLGSIYARSELLLRDTALAVIEKEALATSAACCKLVPAALGDRIGDYAALSVACCGGK